MLRRPLVPASLVLTSLLAACSGSSAADIPTDSDDPELRSSAKGLATGDFATTERAGGQLDPFGCRHYEMLHLKGLEATLEAKLDAADPGFMDPDGSCGGEELPRGLATKFPLRFVEKSSCGAAIFEGTIKWTESGRVTRTLRVTDYRDTTCKDKPARVVAALTSTFEGQTNPIATYFTVDPRK
ncbi:MAG TPA: hypothetical protein VLT33_05315 [Labilithrix sp.]|nr:hypothetical protein [Labilithrix sp.]